MPRQTNVSKDRTIHHVVALVLENHQGEILIAKRDKNKHQGGLWEFPGGKVESGETRFQALQREIKEELDYKLIQATPLKCITHRYTDISIKLDVWFAKDIKPIVKSNENQPLKWVTKAQLPRIKMPAADKPIIDALLSLKT